MSVGFRKGEGLGTSTVSESWQKSKLWNCKKCGADKFRNKCTNDKCPTNDKESQM